MPVTATPSAAIWSPMSGPMISMVASVVPIVLLNSSKYSRQAARGISWETAAIRDPIGRRPILTTDGYPGQQLGQLYSGQATDLNTGPVLALMGVAVLASAPSTVTFQWPIKRRARLAARA